MNLYKAIKVAVVNHQTLLAMILIQLSYAGMALISKAAFNEGMSPLVLNAYRQAIATTVLVPFAFLLERLVFLSVHGFSCQSFPAIVGLNFQKYSTFNFSQIKIENVTHAEYRF